MLLVLLAIVGGAIGYGLSRILRVSPLALVVCAVTVVLQILQLLLAGDQSRMTLLPLLAAVALLAGLLGGARLRLTRAPYSFS